jgi:hypothetical protein
MRSSAVIQGVGCGAKRRAVAKATDNWATRRQLVCVSWPPFVFNAERIMHSLKLGIAALLGWARMGGTGLEGQHHSVSAFPRPSYNMSAFVRTARKLNKRTHNGDNSVES